MLCVLAVDDQAPVRAALESCLEPYGFEVDHAENGAMALRMVKARPYDVVFLDLNMPVLDGPGLLRVLRAQGETVPVVLVTSSAERALVGQVLKLGAADYVSKPFTPEAVRATLERVLRIDLAELYQGPPHVLVLDPFGIAAAQLRALLPASVRVEEAADAAALAARGRARSHQAFVVDADAWDDAAAAAVAELRAAQPHAAFLVAGDVPEGVAGAFDGALPVPLEEEPVRRGLYEAALRPTAFARGNTLRLATLRDAEPSVFYSVAARRLTQLARSLASRAVSLKVDLTRTSPSGEGLERLIAELQERLEELGMDPTFVVRPGARAHLASVEALARTVFASE
jgi:CheY-like chemotaxis protein